MDRQRLEMILTAPPRRRRAFTDETEALRRGDKPMSLWGDWRIGTGWGDLFQREQKRARDARLLMVLRPERHGPHESTSVMMVRPDQAWRVSALCALRDAFRSGDTPWTEGSEILHSMLLGYGEKNIAAWMEWFLDDRAVWGSAPLFVLLDRRQVRMLTRVGWRAFPPGLLGSATTAFHVTSGRVIRKDAHQRLGELTLARFGIAWKLFLSRFGPWPRRPRGDVHTRTLTDADALELNRALASKIERLTARGWR